jgi:anti-sigma-K factor RskA
LAPIDPGAGDFGKATIERRRGPDGLTVEAFLETPSTSNEAFEIWLYNGPGDAVSLGAQVSDKGGDFAGRSTLPANWRDYRFIDISREPLDQDVEHSGASVLRGSLRPPAG